MDTTLYNANNSSHGEVISDPTPGFKDILSRWKDKDTTSHDVRGSIKNMPLDITTVGRKTSREQAKEAYEQKKKESLTKSDVDKSVTRNALRQPKNVYQQPLQHKHDFVPPTFSHTDAERDLIKSALRRNFVFSDLSSRDLKPLIAAFEMCVFTSNQTIISQGEPGDFFYIIQEGKVKFQVNGKTVGKAGTGNSFGELALLYTCPRAATVIATKDSTRLFRVDQMTFRFILQRQTKQSENEKTDLLRGVNFLKDLDASDIKKLSSVMTPRFFSVDDVLVRKGEPGDAFYVLQEGKVLVKDISVGSTVYEDQVLGAGEYFGERSLCTSEPRAANVVGLTRGVAFSIDRTTFEKVLGSMSRLILKAQDVRKLAGVSILQNAGLDGRQMASLAELITDVNVKAGTKVLTKGEKARAALYFVREGEVEVTKDCGTVKVPAGGYFGQCLMIDASKKLYPLVTCQFSLSVPVDSVLGMLSLSDCRTVFDTEVLGMLESESDDKPSETSQLTSTLRLKDLQRHKILGAGTFGQVWLVSGQEKGKKDRSAFALKIQSKSDLAVEGQIKAVIEEKNIMCKMRHPFISQLIQTYQDESFVYMLVELIQGGELFSIIHDVNAATDGVPEMQARFYAFGVADALAYLHRAKYVFRDLKPENVLIDAQGYPKLIDFGFAKYVPDKTYTLCGTPGYLPPEVVMTRGHDCSADRWSLGILIYEMITGDNPFYYEGMDQMSLFRSIVQDGYEPPVGASRAAADLISKLLTKDPTQRIGSLARGEREIFEHEWFAKLDRHAMKRKELKAPWVPAIKDPFDTSCFDDWDHLVDKTTEEQPPLDDKDMELFKDF